MTDQHPIIPPPELVVEWADTIYQQTECDDQRDLYVATRAAHYGADQELEACCEWFLLEGWHPDHPNKLRAARRHKTPSLKEQALQALEAADFADYPVIATILTTDQHALIRTALEMLPD